MLENTAPGTEFSRIFCAGIVSICFSFDIALFYLVSLFDPETWCLIHKIFLVEKW